MKSGIRSLLFGLVTIGVSTAYAERLDPGATEGVVFVGAVSDHGTIGAGIGRALNTRWLVMGEIGYVSSRAAEFAVNGHYVFPIRNHPDLTPYALVGLGVLAGSGKNDARFGANIGGGLRWQTGKNWGIRPEIRALIGDGSYGRFTVGLFYNFGN